MKDIAPIGVDLAKNVIQVHGVDQRGKLVRFSLVLPSPIKRLADLA